MKSFRQLCSAIVLTLVLAMSALAGHTETPPGCVEPGDTQTPPCFAAPGETQGPGLAASGDMETSMLDILWFAIQSILPG